MRLLLASMSRPYLIAAAVAVFGCAPADPAPVQTDAGNSTVTYTKDVQPILLAKCSPCHSTDHQGFHNIATNYADVHKRVDSIDSVDCWKDWGAETLTMPKTVGECAQISAKNGRMPMGMGCDQSPKPSTCVTSMQQEILAAWVAAGMPQ